MNNTPSCVVEIIWFKMVSEGKSTENETLYMYLENILDSLTVNKSNLELTAAESLSTFVEIGVVSVLFMSLIIGSYFKTGLYLYMYDHSKELLNSPINLLLLIQALIEHLVCTFMVTFFTTYCIDNAIYNLINEI